MNRVHQIAWVECMEVGCPSGIAIDVRHVRNFEDRWTCNAHEPHEVTC